MQAEAGESTQAPAHQPESPVQATSSADCSAVHREASAAAQDGATSMPAAPLTSQNTDNRDHSMRSPARKTSRKRKQPDRSDPALAEESTAQPVSDGVTADSTDPAGKTEKAAGKAGRPSKKGKTCNMCLKLCTSVSLCDLHLCRRRLQITALQVIMPDRA